MIHPPDAARGYLDALAAGLPGPQRQRRRVLAEIGDGLEQATADGIARGLSCEAAVAAAIDRFGTPRAVADAFTGELATASARRTLAWFVATGPLVGVWWLLLLHPYPWRAGLVALLAAVPVLPLVAVGLATAAGTFATTGRLMRWLPELDPRRALTAVIGVAALAGGVDLLIIGGWLRSDPDASPLAVVAVAASAIRIGCVLVAVRRAVALRRRLAEGSGRDAGP